MTEPRADELVVGVGDQDQLVFDQALGLDVLVVDGAHEADLGLVLQQHLQHLLGAAGAHRDLDAREAGAEGLEQARQDVGADRRRRGEDQRAGLQVAQRVDGVAAGVQGLQHALGVGQEAGADLGEADAAAGALEQALAQVAFQRLDAGRHRRLSQEQRLRGAAKAALVRDLHEGFKLTEIHSRHLL